MNETLQIYRIGSRCRDVASFGAMRVSDASSVLIKQLDDENRTASSDLLRDPFENNCFY